MPSELKDKLLRWYWEGDPREGFRLLPPNRLNPANIGGVINDLRSLVIHTNNGWMRRSIAGEHIERFQAGTTSVGYHFYIPGEGTLIRSINLDQPRRVSHARHVNGHSLGITALNRFRVNGFGISLQPCSENNEDITGRKLYLTSGNVHNEVTPCWWTTQNYNNAEGIGTAQVNNTDSFYMFYNESQYRTLALTVKKLLEKYSLPCNFPLLPHARQITINNDWDSLRRIILADQRALMLMRSLYNLNPNPVRPNISFDESDEIFEEVYLDNNNGLIESYENDNQIIRNNNGNPSYYIKSKGVFDHFRGIHGHEFFQIDRNDPGPLFDWHRMAREISDYWWYPFDLDGTVPRIDDDTIQMGIRNYRSYRRFNERTPILDYYWDEHENESIYKAVETDSVMPGPQSLLGSSPSTFNFSLPNTTPDATPIYAMANGELVTAKLPLSGENISSGFVLVKHEVFYDTEFPANTSPVPFHKGSSINFNKKPSVVYSLYMHISRPHNIDFDQPNDENPDWLNRLLIRKKECELGIAFKNSDRGSGANFGDNRWNNRPPRRTGFPRNPTTHEAWLHDNTSLEFFLNKLRNGDVALPLNTGHDFDQPINILLGDYIGNSGAIGNSRNGVRVEVCSPSFSPPEFEVYGIDELLNGWDSNSQPNASQLYISEWNDEDWWQVVVFQQGINQSIHPDDRIILNKPVYHFHPFKFMKWINQVTWQHEWPKYKVKDADGNDVERPPRPRTRRIPPAS